MCDLIEFIEIVASNSKTDINIVNIKSYMCGMELQPKDHFHFSFLILPPSNPRHCWIRN
jgi:hypothetical protein